LPAAIGRPLVQSGNRRNYFFIATARRNELAAPWCSISSQMIGVLPWAALPSLLAGLDLILFHRRGDRRTGHPDVHQQRRAGAGAVRHPWVERCALGGTLAVLGADLMPLPRRSLPR
jgi:hypothetical protein